MQLRARVQKQAPAPSAHSVAAIASLVAANLPDADLLYTGIGGDHLRYMLHHRGYTHTIVVALVGAVLVWGITLLLLRWRSPPGRSRGDSRWLLGLLLVSALSHLVLDWTNSYGVHPFWPMDDRWYYGDAVFIIEPWLWVVSVPALVAASRRTTVRVLLGLILAAGLAIAWRVDLVSETAAVCLTIGAALSITLAFVLGPGTRVTVAIGGWIAVTLAMAAGAAAARATTLHAVRQADPNTRVLDIVVSPLPANALCMTVITVEISGGSYRAETGQASAAPSLADASRCGAGAGSRPSLGASSRHSTPAVRWDGEWVAPAAEIATIARESCPALAALRFIRVPVWRPASGTTLLLGDVRYGGVSAGGFTSVNVPRRSAACPSAVPPWIPPRSDVLKGW